MVMAIYLYIYIGLMLKAYIDIDEIMYITMIKFCIGRYRIIHIHMMCYVCVLFLGIRRCIQYLSV